MKMNQYNWKITAINFFLTLGLVTILIGDVQAAAFKNRIGNGDFEQLESDWPVQWTVSDKQRGKGSVEIRLSETKSIKNFLTLIPNAKNRVVEQPFGVLQSIAVGDLAGRSVQLSASMFVQGKTEAAVVMFVMSAEQKILHQSILLSIAENDFKEYSTQADIPENAATIILGCTTSSRKGQAFFDNVSLIVSQDQ